jgi:hypothetical protein
MQASTGSPAGHADGDVRPTRKSSASSRCGRRAISMDLIGDVEVRGHTIAEVRTESRGG